MNPGLMWDVENVPQAVTKPHLSLKLCPEPRILQSIETLLNSQPLSRLFGTLKLEDLEFL